MTDRRSDHDRRGCGENVAAYLLDALSDVEADSFERHLQTCELCREDVENLAPVVGVLPMAVPQREPRAKLKRRIMSVVEAEAATEPAPAPARPSFSRRALGAIFPRPAFAAGIAAAALAIGIGAGVLVTGGDSGSGSGVRTLAADVSGSAGRATLRLGHDGNTLTVANMPSPPGNRVYQVWLARAGAAPKPTNAMFTVDRRGEGTVAVPGSLDGIDQVMVTAEPRGGSRVPTSPPVITAHLDAT
jgi:hypothetical protein